MSFLIFESIFDSRILHKNLKSQIIYEHYLYYAILATIVGHAYKRKIEK